MVEVLEESGEFHQGEKVGTMVLGIGMLFIYQSSSDTTIRIHTRRVDVENTPLKFVIRK